VAKAGLFAEVLTKAEGGKKMLPSTLCLALLTIIY
jgi:hypothetical protein